MAEYPSVAAVYAANNPGDEGCRDGQIWVARGLDGEGEGFSMRNVEFKGDEFGVTLPDGTFLPIPLELLPQGLR